MGSSYRRRLEYEVRDLFASRRWLVVSREGPSDPELTGKVEAVFKLFDGLFKQHKSVVVAYSGGKDSTLLLILLYRWMAERAINGRFSITVLHNDTCSEIDPMEQWARSFMEQIAQRIRELGHHARVVVTVPPARDTFYWRVIVRGYPAPSFSFRWCVKLLKLMPTGRSLRELGDGGGGVLLVGMRDAESSARGKAMRMRYGVCRAAAGKCHAFYFSGEDVHGMRKVAPIRDWDNADVWSYLRSVRDLNINGLLMLYGCEEARYGCWHCTLARVQWGLRVLPDSYQYMDAVRVLYRRISDIPELRMVKNTGYSRLGPLNCIARAMLLRFFSEAERASGHRLYGLDEVRTVGGYTLRQIFYELPSEESMSIIRKEDPDVDPKRLYHIADLRDLERYRSEVMSLIEKLHVNHRWALELLGRLIEYVC